MLIPGIIKVATLFELIFVNGVGLPFNTGLIIYIVCLVALIVYLVDYSRRKRKVVLNTIIVSFAVFVTGYFSYGIILIRSAADPPMDQNNPESVFSLLSYMNREQYGQSPLFWGHYYNAPFVNAEEGKNVYTRIDGKYKVTHHQPKLKYDERFNTWFPRMWSNDPRHVEAYRHWGKIKGNPVTITTRNGENQVVYKPTFGENLRFFIRYQVGHMYLRYFMWNFSGRQNDMQGHGEVHLGNWLSGINFIDEARLGQQKDLPGMFSDNPARNRYFMLPLMLGIIGFVFHFRKSVKSFWVILLLFVMTGLAIVVFLNQNPFQPRERDYAYAGSFYAFSIWIGMGALALAEGARRKRNTLYTPSVVAGLLLLIPGLMAVENWDDHDRSGRYTARDFAYNYLNSCERDAILFTNGDNDTFPLWYAQEVEGIRTDVRVINLSYLGADWYIEQMARKAYDSEAVPFAMGEDLYRSGKRDIVYLVDRIKEHVDLGEAMDFLRSEDTRTKTLGNYTEPIYYIPASKFIIPIDSARILETGTVRPKLAGQIIPQMRWTIEGGSLMKNQMMVLDLIDNNDWERPVYFAITVARDLYLNLQEYFQLQGLAYRIVPIQHTADFEQIGSIDTDLMFENMVNKFRWGGVSNTGVYLDENIRRMMTNFRNNFGRLALELIAEGDSVRALATLDRCMEIMPHERIPFGYFMVPVIEAYYQLGEIEKANRCLKILSESNEEELRYFLSLDPKFRDDTSYDKQLRMHIIQETVRLTSEYQQDELFRLQQKKFEELVVLYQING